MKLTVEQIAQITQGAVRVEEKENGVVFHRFTEAQEAYYRMTNPAFYKKSLAPAGVRLCFKTNSRTLFLKTETDMATTRLYYAFDVFVNGEMLGSLDNFYDWDVPAVYSAMPCRLGEAEKHFDLGVGEKTVCIHLPWSVTAVLSEMSLDDGASIEPIVASKKLLVFGDSITQGYDALHPSSRYIAQLADFLGMEEINKAIGGEIFCPDLARCEDAFTPDLITVAYGTNDWSGQERVVTEERCFAFFAALRKNYPNVPIVAITPIWRANFEEKKAFGSFFDVEVMIRRAAEQATGVLVVSGFDFVPHDVTYFADAYLHPSDAGFEKFFAGLKNELA